jgi:hypothetical protein
MELRQRAVALRRGGHTYTEISRLLRYQISKSTLTTWLSAVSLSPATMRRLQERRESSLTRAQEASRVVRRKKRDKYLRELYQRNAHLKNLLKSGDIAKIALIILYLGEGTKNPKRGCVTFGNADPSVIRLFLALLRKCYSIKEEKFRCTIQCRHDQNARELERFWSSVTRIPLSLFYDTRVDARTIGAISRNTEYKGVCRLDYFSADVLNDLLKGIEVLTTMGR